MEEALSSKMKEFMTAFDQVRKNKALLFSLTDFAIIISVTIIIWQIGNIIPRLDAIFTETYKPNTFISLSQLFVLAFGITFAIYWVNRKVKAVKVDQWKSALDEGPPGAIKLLQEINWEDAYKDIRYAKVGFAIFGLAKIFAYWLFTAFIFTFAGEFLLNAILHVAPSVMLLTLDLLSVAIVLFFSRKDLQNRYDQIGRLDALLWELRWFDNEFRRADFKT